MFDVMSQAKNAMEAFNIKQKIIASNIFNQNTASYKRIESEFESIYGSLIKSGMPAYFNDQSGGTNPMQIGGSVRIAQTSLDFSVGADSAGNNLSQKILAGNGFFVISKDSGRTFSYTRSGDFKIINGKMVTGNGYQVYGFNTMGSFSSSSLVPIDVSGSDVDTTALAWDENGILRKSFDPESSTYGESLSFQVALVSFTNPSGLLFEGNSLYSESASSGPPSQPFNPAGIIKPRTLEMSNVDYATEVIASMEIQRSLDAALSVIKMANDSITAFINKLA